MHEDDFRVRAKTIDRYGASAIPQDSSLVDWPVSYNELEPFYDKAEYELGVSGKASNVQGKKIDGGNVFEAPRKREYPLPPLLMDQSAVLFEAGAKKLGLHPFSTPRAIISQPHQDRPGCTYCGFCQAFGCHVGAKSSILVTKLPEADATGNFKLITGGDRARDGRASGLAGAGEPGGRSRCPPRGRHAHGQRSEGLSRKQVRPDLGSSKSVPDRQFDLPHHGGRFQSDADDPGARLHVGGCDREPLPEEPGTVDLTTMPRAGPIGPAATTVRSSGTARSPLA
jgi:hypothetical protein